MALSGFSSTDVREQFDHLYEQKGSTTIYGGGVVVAAADGYAKAGLSATGLVILGVAFRDSVNAGADGAVKVRVITSRGPDGKMRQFRLKNASAGDACTIANIGRDVYLLDDEAATTTATGRSVVGKLRELEKDATGTLTGYVWIELPV